MSAELWEALDERAALIEFEAGLPRDEAEDLAFLSVCARAGLGCPACATARYWFADEIGEPEVERINRFLEDCPSAGHDRFIDWLLTSPYIEPTGPSRARRDHPEGWQDDPQWWTGLEARGLLWSALVDPA